MNLRGAVNRRGGTPPPNNETSAEEEQSHTSEGPAPASPDAADSSIADENDDNITVIVLDPSTPSDFQVRPPSADNDAVPNFDWMEQGQQPEQAPGNSDSIPTMEERRRNILLGELQRVQRTSFIHFVLLCSIPVILLVVVLATALGDVEDCSSSTTNPGAQELCFMEDRNFMNAFTTRCVCQGVAVMQSTNETNIP